MEGSSVGPPDPACGCTREHAELLGRKLQRVSEFLADVGRALL